ncbi:hypothetical protein ACHQM5_004273 [Ranunculus cassubicifolius]
MPTHVGINMGSTNTYISVMEEGSQTPKFITKIPTLIEIPFQKPENTAMDHKNQILGFNRLISRMFEDPFIQKEVKKASFRIVRGPNGADTWVQASNGIMYNPSHFLEDFLMKVKEIVEAHLGYSVSTAVFTFPAKVNRCEVDVHSDATLELFSRGYYVNEFTAAVAAYGLINKKGLYGIVDLGGKSLDVTLFQVSFGAGASRSFNLKGPTKTDMFLGGEDFDDVIVEFLMSEVKKSEGSDGIDLRKYDVARHMLRKVAEKAKIDLSTSTEIKIDIPDIAVDESRVIKGLSVGFTRAKFENLANELISRIKTHCKNCLKNAGVKAKKVDQVLLVGGMARVPMVKRVVSEVFGKSPVTVAGVNPEEAVCLGAAAAVQAECLGILVRSFES